MTAQDDFDTAAAFGDSGEMASIWGAASVAQTGNFLEATRVPLAAPKALAPVKAVQISTAAKLPTVNVSTSKGATKAPAIAVPTKPAAAKAPAAPAKAAPAPASTKPAITAGGLLSGVQAGISNAVTTALNAGTGGFAPNTIPPGVKLDVFSLNLLNTVPGARVVMSKDGKYSVETPKAAPAPAGTKPTLTDAERAANAEAIRQAANRTANINAAPGGYSDQRTDAHARAVALNNLIAEGPAGKAGTDLDQFIMGGKVLAAGAAIIASGGTAAGGLGLTAGAGSLAAAASADRLLSAIETGGAIGKQATAVLNEAKAAAAKGDAIAKTALDVVADVSADRIAAKVPAGVKQVLSVNAKDALATVASMPAVTTALAAANASSGGYMTTPLTTKPHATAPVVNQATKQILATVQVPRALWLVSNAGGITSLTQTPNAAWSGGFVVFSSGLVMRQTAEAAALAAKGVAA